ncbi:hypothetical protein AgCh_024154 [Apium graveolens]
MQIRTSFPEQTTMSDVLPDRDRDILALMIEKAYEGHVTFAGTFRFGDKPVPQEITTFPDLFTCMWNFCAKRRLYVVALIGVLVLIMAFYFFPRLVFGRGWH